MSRDEEDNGTRLAQHERLVQGLLQHPDAMSAPPGERSLLGTHISSLVLTAREVFKLRKPLALDFLDFSSAALRRADCEQELRLNRRTAPQVYIDVQPVTGTPDAPRLGGHGDDAIDWALRMRRFDDTLRLDRLADRGQLSASHVDALAKQVAQFHSALPPSPPEFGQPATVRHWAIENFDALQAGPAARTRAADLQALRLWTESEFARIEPLLAERRAAGLVREGHGDLHLGNIVLVDGQPVPFDCLEFNPALRHTDVMADVAFLFMDLQRHGLGAMAWRLVNAYAEHSGDYAGLPTLRFFAVYRALVRAKVALLRAEQQDSQAWAAFERDLRLAQALAAPRTGPLRLVLTSGVSGSGKSTLAQMLLESLGAIRVRSDVERKRLHGMATNARPHASQAPQLYGSQANERTYARLAEIAAALLGAGLHTIVDAAFLRRRERERLRQTGTQHGAQTELIECQAPAAVLRQRVRRRLAADNDASDADLAVLARQLQEREPAADDEHPFRIDTDCTLDALRASALHCLGIEAGASLSMRGHDTAAND
jgi:aminoglycoside phosphotransferase family enzyme/predicted kinase